MPSLEEALQALLPDLEAERKQALRAAFPIYTPPPENQMRQKMSPPDAEAKGNLNPAVHNPTLVALWRASANVHEGGKSEHGVGFEDPATGATAYLSVCNVAYAGDFVRGGGILFWGGEDFGHLRQVLTPAGTRRQGGATAVMAQVCTFLDQRQLKGALWASSDDPAKFSNEALKAFYRTFGFQGRLHFNDAIMVREPTPEYLLAIQREGEQAVAAIGA